MSNPMQTHGAPSWIEYKGTDAAAARKFYEDVLGWQVNDIPMQDGSSYPAVVVGEAPVGGFSQQPAAKGGWTIYVTVDNVDTRYAKALAAGASAVSEPIDVPGVGRMATIADPQGGTVAFITYESQQ